MLRTGPPHNVVMPTLAYTSQVKGWQPSVSVSLGWTNCSPLHVADENLPAVQVALAGDGAYPSSHTTLQVPPLGVLVPAHVMVPLLSGGVAVHASAAKTT